MNIEDIVNTAMELHIIHDCGLEAATIAATMNELIKSVNKLLVATTGIPETPKNPDKEEVKDSESIRVCLYHKDCKAYKTPPCNFPGYIANCDGPELKEEFRVEPAPPAVTLDKLRAMVQALVKAGKKQKVADLLAAYKAKLLTDIVPDAYEGFKMKLEAL